MQKKKKEKKKKHLKIQLDKKCKYEQRMKQFANLLA